MTARGGVTRHWLIGLAAVVPFWITTVVVIWLAGVVEGLFGRITAVAVPPEAYLPGIGLAIGVLLVWFVGLLVDGGPGRRVLDAVERGLERVPIVRSIYGTTRDLMTYLVDAKTNGRKHRFNKVVSVRVGDGQAKLVGLVTREDLTGLTDGLNSKQSVMVYLPMSYQLGGYTIIVPRSAIELVDMSVEDALRLTMTAGVSAEAKAEPSGR